MKILLIGGNGNISWHCTNEAVLAGHEVWIMNRGVSTHLRRTVPSSVVKLIADIRNPISVKAVLGDTKFDVVADFLCQTTEHAQNDIELFKDRTDHFIFISSTAIYQKPINVLPITESTPLQNRYWDYAKNKIASEETFLTAFRGQGFPITIIRPSHTYDTIIPEAVGYSDWTVSQRMLDGKPILLHGDGSTLWTLTHAEDFARAFILLLGNASSVGHAFHITSDEWLTWRQITEIVAKSLGAQTPQYVFVPSENIYQQNTRLGETLLGHKMWCDIYDNTKIKSFAKGWQAKIPFREGIHRTLDWFNQEPARKRIDHSLDKIMDSLCVEYSKNAIERSS
jgi:nucleoside-diphosphate-sugar epimerase